MKGMELYFNDLTAEAQKKYMEVAGVSDPSELNWEVSPIAIIEVEENQDDESTIPGTFVSIWSDGSSIQTKATLNLQTGKVTAAQSDDTSDHGSLEQEYFEDINGQGHQICMDCHEYIVKTIMDPDKVGKGLSEIVVCSNPECDSRR